MATRTVTSAVRHVERRLTRKPGIEILLDDTVV
jgi:hypothetical protein